MQIHCNPKQVTTLLWLERTASRYIPLAAIDAPLRRSSVSSMATTIGQPGGNKPIDSPNRMRAPRRPDQRARLSTRW